MNWSEMIDRVAAQTDLPKTTVKRALDGFEEAALAALRQGDEVSLKGLGRLDVREVAPRPIRRVNDQRKYYLGRRHKVRLKAGAAARRAVAELAPDNWKLPEHQAAWRKAETLLADLDLYHGSRAPSLESDLSHAQVRSRLSSSFGSLWEQVRRSYEGDVSASVRESSDYLAEAALRRWSR